MVLLRVVEAHALLEMGVRLGQLAEIEPATPRAEVGLQEERRVVETPGQAETLLCQLPRRLMLGSSQIQHMPHSTGKSSGVSSACWQSSRARLYVAATSGAAYPLVAIKAGPSVVCKVSSAWRRAGVSGRVVSSDALPEVGNRFDIGRALHGALPGLLPVADGLGGAPRFGVVVRHQLGLGLDRVGEAGLQHLGHLLVILLPRALQQGGIRRVLHQGMLKDIFGARRTPRW